MARKVIVGQIVSNRNFLSFAKSELCYECLVHLCMQKHIRKVMVCTESLIVIKPGGFLTESLETRVAPELQVYRVHQDIPARKAIVEYQGLQAIQAVVASKEKLEVVAKAIVALLKRVLQPLDNILSCPKTRCQRWNSRPTPIQRLVLEALAAIQDLAGSKVRQVHKALLAIQDILVLKVLRARKESGVIVVDSAK